MAHARAGRMGGMDAHSESSINNDIYSVSGMKYVHSTKMSPITEKKFTEAHSRTKDKKYTAKKVTAAHSRIKDKKYITNKYARSTIKQIKKRPTARQKFIDPCKQCESKMLVFFSVIILTLTVSMIAVCIFIACATQLNKMKCGISIVNFQQTLNTLVSRLQQNAENISVDFSNSIDSYYQQVSQNYSLINSLVQQQLKVPINMIYQRGSQGPVFQRNLQQVQNDIGNSLQRAGYTISSCAALPPFFTPDYYWIGNSFSLNRYSYCDVTIPCGSKGWRRVANLDMNNHTHSCPIGFQQDHNLQFNLRTCIRAHSLIGCNGVGFNTGPSSYSRVCGRVIGYHSGSTNAFDPTQTINDAYVDGVVLTHGHTSQRQHLWTFAAASDEEFDTCICNNNQASRLHTTSTFCGE